MNTLKPTAIYIETTNKCNAKCIMCPNTKMTRKRAVMSEQIFEKTIDAISNLDLNDLQLFLHKEGEPLLDPDITARIKHAKNQLPNLKELIINTNAMLLTEKTSIELLESGLDTIYFSIDGASPETYNNIRLGLDYDSIASNVEKFFETHNKNKSNVKVIMQMLTDKHNMHEVDLFKKKWEDKKCEFYIKPMHCYLDGGSSSFQPDKSNYQLNVCDDPFRMMVIYADGSIGVCCWDYDNLYKVGHIDDDSLIKIFNNKKFTYLRDMQLKKNCSNIDPCNRCMRIYGNDTIAKLEPNTSQQKIF